MPCKACGKKLALNTPFTRSTTTFRMGFTRFRTTQTTQTTRTQTTIKTTPKAFTLGF
jgi:hypothetical protein